MVNFDFKQLAERSLETKIEGILLSKLPFKERHLICHLLLRSGKKIGVIFYGGMGGGKKQKSTILELGHMLKIELKETHKQKDLYSAKEWSLLWSHEKIRTNHQAFYLMCFYLELMTKISQEDHLDGDYDVDSCQDGNFRVLSNALVFLENSLKEGTFQKEAAFSIFIGKLLLEQGIFPHLDNCCLSDERLDERSQVVLLPEEGGFANAGLTPAELSGFYQSDDLGRELWRLLKYVKTKKSSELTQLKLNNNSLMRILFNYLSYQLHMTTENFKSLALVM